MDIYNYHSETNEYLGKGAADPNPVREDAWLVPAFATTTEPPAAETGKARVWAGSRWETVADHRGETWWPNDAADNRVEPVTIDFLGNPTEKGLTNIEPPAPPVPPIVVDARQIRLAMTQLGWRQAVETYVASADQDTKDTWQFGTRFSEQDKFVADLAAGVQKSTDDTAALFALAKTL